MGKTAITNTLAEQELTKLQAQLHQSAHDTWTYLEALKHNLTEFDHKHHLHTSSSAASFFYDGLDHARDVVKDLKHSADHIHKDAGVNEVNAARRAMEQTFNALADLHKVANAYDTEHPTPNKHSDKKPTISDKVEWLVSTTRDAKFSGFAPLQRQIIEVQVALGIIERPSIAARAKEAVHHMADKIDSKFGKKGTSPKAEVEQHAVSSHSA
ncbi:uncharacterized protein PITG_01239 [Phytophthora infestans T30-4]|uniref:Uncharacterized protein n=2 Tax=Phytophthora infestans TaxID=4787 RepID=D0MUZ9_PHYIT|nr:uncharacterized protein PITG_01239 [Phytophthora infestans T30-4]EEY60995.1 conserved hypothetical protein [Phytophthora infestans T30-4]KAF4042682.1 hypothetical protein GN244_ATG04988 [Phytophthora infestans]KAF4128038.1 hypothetical protein GN958_ATG22866 [Phytophthora infestans]|eukprot:XP_002907912.1 conserved hypothetical protein [Phytophthora infestans T30-4]